MTATNPPRPHSSLGIFALLMGVFAAFLEVAAFITIFATTKENLPVLHTSMGIVILVGLGVAFFGEVIAFVSLLFASSKKLFGILALLMNGFILLGFAVAMALGLLVKFMK